MAIYDYRCDECGRFEQRMPMGTVMKDGGLLHIEDGLPASLLEELARRGHVMKPEPVGAYGGYQAIWRDPVTGMYSGATEKRKDGCAAGY